MNDNDKLYDIVKDIPIGEADDSITEGAIVLEGGAFRGLYQEGVLDCLMQNGINFQTTIGVSAGALNGVNYVAGHIGRSAHINIRYRHDGRYVGIKPFIKTRKSGRCIINLDFALEKLPNIPDLNTKRLMDPKRRFVAVATSLETGKAKYFDNKREDIINCVKASATLPYFSKPVIIDGKPYLDGGCDDRIPFRWALKEGYNKVIVIKTRDRSFRIKPNFDRRYGITKRWYSQYPDFSYILARTDEDYNAVCNELDRLEKKGKVFVIAPSSPINIKMLEKDVYKLRDIYFMGYNDCMNSLEALKEYLNK